MKSGIYRIKNCVTGMSYIGSAVNILYRWKNHKIELRLDRHQNRYLQNAYNKYGSYNFEFIVLEYCEKPKLIDREQHWIDFYQSANRIVGYNLSPTAGNCIGVKHSDETKALLSEIKKGKPRSEETKIRIKETMKGRQFSPETKEKMRIAQLGKRHTEEFKKKMSERLKGNKYSAGTTRSKEHLAAMFAGRNIQN